MQNLRRLIQIILNFRHLIRTRRILIFLNIFLHHWKVGRLRRCLHAFPRVSEGGCEFVEELGEEDEGDAGGVFGVGDDGAGEAVGADVAVDYVGFVAYGLALTGFGSFGEGFGEEG